MLHAIARPSLDEALAGTGLDAGARQMLQSLSWAFTRYGERGIDLPAGQASKNWIGTTTPVPASGVCAADSRLLLVGQGKQPLGCLELHASDQQGLQDLRMFAQKLSVQAALQARNPDLLAAAAYGAGLVPSEPGLLAQEPDPAIWSHALFEANQEISRVLVEPAASLPPQGSLPAVATKTPPHAFPWKGVLLGAAALTTVLLVARQAHHNRPLVAVMAERAPRPRRRR